MILTVALKLLYLAAGPDGGIGVPFPALLLFAFEPVEAFALLALALGIGRCFRLPTEVVVGAVVFLAAIAGGGNYLAYREISGFLTLDSLALAARWAWHQPEVVWPFMTSRCLAGVALAIGWAIGPLAVASGLARSAPAGYRAVRAAQVALLVALAVSAASAGSLALTTGGYAAPPIRGYWSTALAAFARLDQTDPSRMRAPDATEVRRTYVTLAFPGGLAPEPVPLVTVPVDRRRPRHVLVVSLETAPRSYYPIDEAHTPMLARMSRHALTSDRHYTAALSTSAAVFSMLSGLYPRSAIALGQHGGREGEGLATRLARHGYNSTYIDSYAIDWEGRSQARALLEGLGFHRLHETYFDPALGEARGLERASRREEQSFRLALQSVLDAQASGRKAFVVLVTYLGHHPWRAPAGEEALPASERLTRIARRIDELLGVLLSALDARGLAKEVIVVVTGDHGLRFRAEFESLGERPEHGELRFNVPLVVYAPAVFRERVSLPYMTSHVDLAPTVLELLGMGTVTEGGVFHGLSVMDRRLEDRITFLMGGGMMLVNSFHWRGRLYTADVAGRVHTRPMLGGASSPNPVLPNGDVRRILQQAQVVFDATAAYFTQRGPGLASH